VCDRSLDTGSLATYDDRRCLEPCPRRRRLIHLERNHEVPDIEKSERREASRRRERYGQRGQAKWWHAVARSQARRAHALEERAAARGIARRSPLTPSADNRDSHER
jgi:hypothetical protein